MGLSIPENLLAWENPKRWRESREILKILQFQKELKKKHPWTFEKRGPSKKSEPSVIQIRGMQGSVSGKNLSIKFSEFKHTSSDSTLNTPLEGNVGLVTFGIGIEF